MNIINFNSNYIMQTDLKIDELQSKQPTKVGQYILNNNIRVRPKFINQVGMNSKQTRSRSTNIESSLLGLGKPLNKYPVLPKPSNNDVIETKSNKIPEIDFIIGESTKESKSCNHNQFYDATKRFILLSDPVQVVNKIIFNERMRGGQNSRIP